MSASSPSTPGRFAIESAIGRGGMGTVYRAVDLERGSLVALKKLHRTGLEAAERFLREARVLADLTHPRIVGYIDHGVDASGEAWLAMEWLEGEALSDRLARGPVALDESIALIAHVADALAHAHARGIVHRDIKPANLFLVSGEIAQVRVLDFGVARTLLANAQHTLPGAIVGTLGYMSPEQASGASTVDARADIFALGCVWFELLTGRAAFAGVQGVALLARILFEEVPAVKTLRADVPAQVSDLIARMLAKDPSVRPPDGAALGALLRSLGTSHSDGSAPSHGITETEHRLVSVVLLDPVRDARGEESTVVLRPSPSNDDLVEAVRAVALAHGARFERLAQGTMVAVLSGAGVAVDLAARAARCALALGARAKGASVALATGRADLSGVLPVGPALDRAALLLRDAVPHAVRVDDVTAGLLDARFEVGGDAGGLLVLGEMAEREGARTLLGRPMPFVGRERDLSALEGFFEDCVAESVARAVLVTAGPGSGKTRLRQELVAKLANDTATPEIWLGRGDLMLAGSPFGLLAGAIRRAAGIRDGDDVDLARRKLRARLSRHVPARDLPRILEFIGEMTGLAGTEPPSPSLTAARQNPRLMSDQITQGFVDLLRAECAQQPVVLVLEDLHWSDGPSVQLTEMALGLLSDQAFMVLALARPEVHDVFPNLWGSRRAAEIRLGDLSARACEKLVRTALGAVADDGHVRLAVERAAGNALYLEEIIRAMAQGTETTLPETVLAMVTARLEALEPEARRVLRAASVFGQGFGADGVAAVLGGGMCAEHVEPRLAELAQREVFVRRPGSQGHGGDAWYFRHALFREAAYAAFTEGDRALAHRLAGTWIERARNADPAVLALHAQRAGDQARAVTFHLRAAHRALEGNDFTGALAHASSAIGCGADGAAFAEVSLVKAQCHQWRGELADVERCAEHALAGLEPASSSWYRAVALCADSAGKRGRRERVEVLADLLESRRLDGPLRAAPTIAWAHTSVALEFVGDLRRARIMSDVLAGIDADVPTDDPVVRVNLARLRAIVCYREGDIAGYITAMEAVVAGWEALGNRRSACFERPNLALGLLEVGEPEHAATVLEGALHTAETMGLGFVTAVVQQKLGLAWMRLGRTDDALAIEGRSVAALLAQGERRMAAGSRTYLAEILARLDRIDEAVAQARQAVEEVADHPPVRIAAQGYLARILLRAGCVGEAVGVAREAVRSLGSDDTVHEGEVQVRLGLAEALAASGDHPGAQAAIVSARDRLFARAARIRDPERAHGFLHRVEDHRRTMELAALLNGTGNGSIDPATRRR